uniref:(northern house mosquito) hypothetical protein n=1 Tax=Culex pipiens TaxID=7175 RepID=A0A8D8MWP1_CULPI
MIVPSSTPAGPNTAKIVTVKIATPAKIAIVTLTGGGTAPPARTIPATVRTTNRPERRRGRRKSPTSTNSIGASTRGSGIVGRGIASGTTGGDRPMKTRRREGGMRTSRRKPRRVNGSAVGRGREKRGINV